MKIAKHVVEFVGGFAIGVAAIAAAVGFQMLLNKAFENKKGGER